MRVGIGDASSGKKKVKPPSATESEGGFRIPTMRLFDEGEVLVSQIDTVFDDPVADDGHVAVVGEP